MKFFLNKAGRPSRAQQPTKTVWHSSSTKGWVVACAVILSTIAAADAANVLTNPGFESGLTSWQTYGANNYAITDSHAHTGTNLYKVYGVFSTSDNYTGLFQDCAAAPGNVYTADGWAFSLSADGGGIHGQDQYWFEVTFRDAGFNALALYRSDLITSNNIGTYGGLDHWFNLSVTNAWSFTNDSGNVVPIARTNGVTNLVAPAGTAFVRYQTVFHQGPDNANGSMYVDDCTLNQSVTNTVTNSAWNIVWSDEFNGTSIATTNWTFEIGNNGGWGNNELEYYTNAPQNAYVSNGILHIVALQQNVSSFHYTSARMKSQNKFSKQYGRIEFRAKVPYGVGFWPAVWMLGNNFGSAGWPACGEIDILENKGSVPGQVQGTIHYSTSTNNDHLQSTAFYNFPANNGATNFHTYRLDWTTNAIKWLVDGQTYETQTSWSTSTGPYPAPFNQPFYFIMNLAVGGNYLGNPAITNINANSVFPGDLQIDYLRVYDLTPPLQISAAHGTGVVNLSWPASIVCRLQAQTNAAGLGSTWFDVPGAANPYSAPINPGNKAVFYRLISP